MSEIQIQTEEKPEAFVCAVSVADSRSTRQFLVTVKKSDYQRLTGGRVSIDELVRKSFEFLLEREPKESILSQFDLTVIGHYFPEYEGEITRRL